MASPQNTPSDPIVAAAQLLQDDPARAESQIRAILHANPDDPQALLVLAVALRLQGRSAEALHILGPLAEKQPNWVIAQQELGLALSAQGAWSAALGALRKAVELAPSLPSAWRALADALYALGDADEADLAYECFVRNASSDPLLREAVEALQNGRADVAEAHARLRLKFEPTDIVAARLLADICRHTERADEAERLLADVITRARSFWPAQLEYVDTLLRLRKYSEALAHIEELLRHRPDTSVLLRLKSFTLANLGRFEDAIDSARQLVEMTPGVTDAMLELANLLRVTGAQDEAIQIYNRVIAVDPSRGEAYLGLANLKTYAFTEFEVEAMKLALKRKELADQQRIALGFALGQALDQLDRYDEAFQNFATANALKRMQVEFNIEAIEDLVRSSKESFTRSFFADRAEAGMKQPKPIFIIGMPRSGSTLVEQILAAHSQVEALGEAPIVYELVGQLLGNGGDEAYSHVLRTISQTSFAQLAGSYMAQAEGLKRTKRPRIIDKTPNNFLHMGLIQLMFPSAIIIDVRRHPMACGLSNFTHLFSRGLEFTYRLNEIGRYYRAYVRLMAHYDEVFPGRIYRVFYEDLVAEPATRIRALLAHCGLSFEEACLNPHAVERPIMTLSAGQVRQPMHNKPDERWRQYETWLMPLANALGPVLAAYPNVPDEA